MRRNGALSLLVAAATLLASAVPASAQDLPTAQVVRVVDGDTVDIALGGAVERVRLIGVDTPETVDPRKPVQCFGREAASRARELLTGQTVAVELDASQGQRDRYGRLLAYLRLPDGTNVGQALIAEGFAHEYTYRLPYAYQGDFKAAQEWATANALGLWSPETCAGTATQSDLDDAAVAPIPLYQGRFDPNGPDRDCGDFATWPEAQAFFHAAGGPESDRHRLDADRDGLVCESRPGFVAAR